MSHVQLVLLASVLMAVSANDICSIEDRMNEMNIMETLPILGFCNIKHILDDIEDPAEVYMQLRFYGPSYEQCTFEEVMQRYFKLTSPCILLYIFPDDDGEALKEHIAIGAKALADSVKDPNAICPTQEKLQNMTVQEVQDLEEYRDCIDYLILQSMGNKTNYQGIFQINSVIQLSDEDLNNIKIETSELSDEKEASGEDKDEFSNKLGASEFNDLKELSEEDKHELSNMLETSEFNDEKVVFDEDKDELSNELRTFEFNDVKESYEEHKHKLSNELETSESNFENEASDENKHDSYFEKEKLEGMISVETKLKHILKILKHPKESKKVLLRMILFALIALVNPEQISADTLDNMNLLDATRAMGAGIVNSLVEVVQNSLPLKSILDDKPSDDLCKYEATTDVMGVESKQERLVSCLLKDVNQGDDEQTIRGKIKSAANDIVATIPVNEGECPDEELEKMTLKMSISNPDFIGCVVLGIILFSVTTIVTSEQISADTLDNMNILEASRVIGVGIVEHLVKGVQNSLPLVEKIMSEKPSDDLCKYEATTDVMGVDSKKERLVSCLLKDVNQGDDEQTIRDKIISAATDIVATIPVYEGECPVEELENITLQMSISNSVYIECVTKLVFKAIADLDDLGAYEEIENEENEVNGAIPQILLIYFISSVTAVSEICETPLHQSQTNLNGLQIVHLTSFCTVEHIIDLYNRFTDVEQPLHSSSNCSGFDDSEKPNLQLIMTCIIQDLWLPGENIRLSPQSIRERIANSSMNFLQYMNDDQCTKESLQVMSYQQAVEKFYENDRCMEVAILRRLTEPNELQSISLPIQEGRQNTTDNSES
ncbi:hypothetical protein C0J52_08188 [Blattella germanica]|nr:hypothetical protein C0J52_08188 [Blattella germanica]